MTLPPAASPIWHPFTQHGLGEPIPLVTHAEGALLHTADGRTVIDAVSSWWVTTHGHCHPRIMAAVAEQAQKLDQLIFAGWTHEPAEAVAAGLTAIMPPELTRVFFSDSGSTSVEVALKMALGYWHANTPAKGGTPRHRIVVMEHSYHGDTIGAMSVGQRGVFNQPYDPLLFDVGRIPFPAAGAEQETLDALEALCRQTDTAALIVEPLVLGPHGHAAGVPAGGRRPRYPVPVQGPHRRLAAAGGDDGERGDLRRALVHRPGADVLPFLQLHRQPDRLRGGGGQPRHLA